MATRPSGAESDGRSFEALMMMLIVRNHHRTRRHQQIEPAKQHGSGVHVGINAEQAVGEMGGQVEGRARRFVGRSVGSLVSDES